MVLAWVLSYSFYSNAQVTTNPTQSTADLLDPSASNWSGQYGIGMWHGQGGPNPNRLPSDTGFVWGSGNNIISSTISINSALSQAGIQVNGYSYVWRVKNGNANLFANQPGTDDFVITVDVYDASGNLYTTYQYDYSYQHNWTNHSGSETFVDPFLPPSFFSDIVVSAQGSDSAAWQGHYGPEFNVNSSSLTLTFATDPCYNNQLYDPACPGYAQALYNQQCTANPLYDPGCPGYAQALFTQQCSANPLSDPACPGYSNAYYNQQCTINALYDSGCTGYQAALSTCNSNYHLNDSLCPDYTQNTRNCTTNPLYDSNCSGYATAYNNCTANYHLNDSMCPDYANNLAACTLNPLIDTNCSGYATAYFNQQCSLNPLYDPLCKGYSNAAFTQQCNANPKSDPQCPDYYIAMCEDDPLYDMGCVGYDVAYFDQQCSLDAQYDQSCPGYVDLSGNDDVVSFLDPVVDDVINAEPVEPEIYEIPVDSVPQEEIVVEQQQAEADSGFQTVDDDIEEELGELEMMDDIDAEIAALEEESSNEGDGSEAGFGTTNQEDNIEKELADLEKAKPLGEQPRPGKAMPKVDPVESRRDKMRLLIAMKAIEAVKELEAAVTLEQQMDIQRRLLALISFVPDFKNYNEENIQDLANFYPPKPTVDHAFARWFLNDPKFSMMTDLQYR